MAETARVLSIDALKTLKVALWKFAESSNTALADAESDMNRTLMWLENEQASYWAGELRKRQQNVERCKEAVRMKKLFKDSTGGTPSAIDEEKALAVAMRKLGEAQQKIVAVKQWTRRLQKEILMYRGQVTRFATNVSSDIPVAVAALEQMIGTLETYVGLSPTEARSDSDMLGRSASAGGMNRGDVTDQSPGAESRSTFVALRDHTPGAARRAAAERGRLEGTLWKPGAVSVFDRDGLAMLRLPASDVSDDSTVVIAADCWNRDSVYLHRVEPADETDSGWYIGPGMLVEDSSQLSLLKTTVKQLLGARPDVESLLRLQEGMLVVLGATGIAALLDQKNTDLWPEASEPVMRTKEPE